MRILVVCGAGASSTFLVHRMKRLAADRGLTVDITPGSIADLDAHVDAVDIALVGHHLAGSFADIRSRSAAAGITAVLLPALGYDAEGAAVALELAEFADVRRASSGHSVTLASTTTASDPGSLHG